MLTAIDLDDELRFRAEKVGKVGSHRDFPPELPSL
jgi:hypothetical protein